MVEVVGFVVVVVVFEREAAVVDDTKMDDYDVFPLLVCCMHLTFLLSVQ
jgi:hypothetical protein